MYIILQILKHQPVLLQRCMWNIVIFHIEIYIFGESESDVSACKRNQSWAVGAIINHGSAFYAALGVFIALLGTSVLCDRKIRVRLKSKIYRAVVKRVRPLSRSCRFGWRSYHFSVVLTSTCSQCEASLVHCIAFPLSFGEGALHP